jgi:hypothetical protein
MAGWPRLTPARSAADVITHLDTDETAPPRAGVAISGVRCDTVSMLVPGLLFLVLMAGPSSVLALQTPAPSADDADALYARRESLPDARRAEAIWAERLARNPQDFDAAWKIARAHYWLGGHAPETERKAILESGIAAGRKAAVLQPKRPEGHFWIAANMGALAESFGLLQGLKYRGAVKDELMTVLQLDPAFQKGSADRALGRWYYRVPGLFGGSKSKSETHLRASLKYAPKSTASWFFLADTLFALDRDSEARAALQQVIDAPLDPDWAPEDRDFKAKARQKLAALTR